MRCIECGGKTITLDSRDTPTNKRRRRECSACGLRFTTYESVHKPVVKKPKASLNLPKTRRKNLSEEHKRQKRNLYNRRWREKKRREEGISPRKQKGQADETSIV